MQAAEREGEQAGFSNSEAKKALIISVSHYNNDNLQPLDFCRKDGEEMCQLLKSLGYEISDNHKLIGNVAFDTARKAIFDFFDNPYTKADDTLLFYYSGHGVPDTDGDVYLATSEIDPDAPYRSGFSFNDLTRMMNRTASIRVVGILDCCYSGAAKITKGVGKGSTGEAAAILATNAINDKSTNLQEGKGICLLASSQAAQEAYALKEEDHSIFTYYLLEGLRGNEKSVDSSGNVTADTLGKYVYREIISLPPEKRPKQTPIRKLEVSDEIVLAHYPEYVEGYEQIITSLMDEGDKCFLREEYDNAKNRYDRVIKINPDQVDAWYKKGNIFYNLENFEEALKCYDRVVLINPNHVDAWYKKGIIYKKKNKYEQALECYDRAIRIKPNSNIWYERGLALLYLKRSDEALKCFDNAIEIKPKHAEAWYRKGYVFYNMGMKAEAQSCYDRSKEINPNLNAEWYETTGGGHLLSSSQPAVQSMAIASPPGDLTQQPAEPHTRRFRRKTILVISVGIAAVVIALSLIILQSNTFPSNNAPVAEAGMDRTVNSSSLVILDGSSSSDPDENDMITSYKWEQTSGNPRIKLDNPDSANPSFMAPNVTSDTEFAFKLTVIDQKSQSADDSVKITVKPVTAVLSQERPNHVPVGRSIDTRTNENTPVNIALSANDVDNDSLEFTIGTFPSHGSLTGFNMSTNTITYSPAPDYVGEDSFTFKVMDNKGAIGDSATVSISVISAENGIPTVPAVQSVVAEQDTSIPITLVANDTDNDSIRFSIVSQPSHGNLSGTAPNLLYDPQQGYVGLDSFTYKVSDGKANSTISKVTLNLRPQSMASPQETEAISTPAAPIENKSITVKTDKPSYTKGEVITITGTVMQREPGELLWISVVDPNSNEVVVTPIPVTGTNTFTLSFTANNQDLEAIEGNSGNSQMNTSGVYLVTADYYINDNRVVAETTFTFTA